MSASRPEKSPSEPIWHGSDRAWKSGIQTALSFAGAVHDLIEPVTERAQVVAATVFYVAADFNTLFRAPTSLQINLWAQIFDGGHVEQRGGLEWLTPQLAERAVRRHFSQSVDGMMLPADILANAGSIRLEEIMNDGMGA